MPDGSLPRVRPGLAPREHQSTRLLALCFDSAASPKITLGGLDKRDRARAYGWGFAWYPDQSPAALVVKDATSVGDNAMSKLLREWDRFQSTLFVAHLRGGARALPEQDTHPFARAHGGRDWVFAHNGDLDVPQGAHGLADALPLGAPPVYEPIGRTDSERAFCWLLARAHALGARSLADIGWVRLRDWFAELDALGTANFILSDGQDLVAYADAEGYNPLRAGRLVPPRMPSHLETSEVKVDLEDLHDRNRTAVIVSTSPLGEALVPIPPGEMIVARRGAIIYDSAADSEARRLMVPPLSTGAAASAPSMAASSMVPVGEQAQAHAAASTSELDAPPPPTASEPPSPGEDVPPVPSPEAAHEAPRVAPPPKRLPVPAVHHHALKEGEGRLLRVLHRTTYRYQHPVEKSSHVLRLQPVHDRWQDLLQHRLDVSVDGSRRSHEDVFGNAVTRVELQSAFRELQIEAESLVRVRGELPADLHSPSRRYNIPLVWMPWQRQMMTPYLLPPELPESQLRELSDFAMSFVERQDYDLVQTLTDMNVTIYRDFEYASQSTTMATTPFQVFSQRRGVCQDFANLFICMARLLGVPARYRVGYIHTGADYENTIQSDASHAWTELYLPWTGWQGFDPTNGCLVGLDHVRVASGRNYGDATPTAGTIYKGGGGETLSVEVEVDEVEAVDERDPLRDEAG